jgi:hypothetical protein
MKIMYIIYTLSPQGDNLILLKIKVNISESATYISSGTEMIHLPEANMQQCSLQNYKLLGFKEIN